MDRHLNLYEFFNNHDTQLYEDNLSRAFAICLQNDPVFLDHVLRVVLDPSLYERHFNIDYPERPIEIDLHVRASLLEGFDHVVAVACSTEEVVSFDGVTPRNTDKPITDVCLTLNDTCVVFEFKRTGEDCSAQLLGQAEKICEACGGEIDLQLIDLCWSKIVKIALRVLSVQKQLNSENLFTRDFVRFLESRHADWFPQRRLSSIPFPSSDDDPNAHYLSARLNQIVSEVYGADRIVQTGGRFAISVDFGFASEVAVNFPINESEEKSLWVQIWPGDTKGQGHHLFKRKLAFKWPKEVAGYPLEVEPYLKFCHFNRGVSWVLPDEKQSKQTHCRKFFNEFSGKWNCDRWDEFDEKLSGISSGWKSQENGWGLTFEQAFEQSDRAYFTVSPGFALTVKIPYETAKLLDSTGDLSSLSDVIRQIVDGFEKIFS